jgi:hypothetical protein
VSAGQNGSSSIAMRGSVPVTINPSIGPPDHSSSISR